MQGILLVESVMGCHLLVVYIEGKVLLLLILERLLGVLGLTLQECVCCLAVVHASTVGGLELALLLPLHARWSLGSM